jgi:hypothetical protein
MTTTAPSANGQPKAWPAIWKLTGALLIAAALLLAPLDNKYRALWYGEATDACHVPLFFLLTLFLARLVAARWRLAVILGAAALACGAELVQPLIGRSASWRDLAYGVIGVAAAAVWLQTAWRWPLRLVAIAVLLFWPAWRVGPALFDAAWAWRKFPELAISGSPCEARRWYLQGVRMERAGEAVRFHFEPNEDHGSGAILLPVVRDWTGYQTLEITFEFEGEPLKFLISVRDGKKLPPELPRYDLWRRYPPGRHEVRIDLNELARGDGFPPIELNRVQSLHLVAYSDRPQTVVVHEIRLSDPRRH